MTVNVVRKGQIVTASMLAGTDGSNINGPTLVAVPSWVEGALGKFYLYFSHHGGTYIRMAYADRVEGPWSIRTSGALTLAQCAGIASGHIASPEVWIDDANQRFVMCFHGPSVAEGGTQRSFMATSTDGINWISISGVVGPSYTRHFWHNGFHYMLMGALGVRAYRSVYGLTAWELGPTVLPGNDGANPYTRHVAVRKEGDLLRVFYTRKGDAPERILCGTIDLKKPWLDWVVIGDAEVMRPVETYEGASQPVVPSSSGPASGMVNQLRDPCIYEDAGRIWMVYSGAGENSLCLAELAITAPPSIVPGNVTFGPGTHVFTVPEHTSIEFDFYGPCGGGGGDNTSAGSKATGGQGATKALIDGTLLVAGPGGSGAGEASPHNVGLAGVGENAGAGGASNGKGGKGGLASGGDIHVNGADGGDSTLTAGGLGGGTSGHKGGNGGNVGSGNTHGGAGGQGARAKRVCTLTAGDSVTIYVGQKGIKGLGQANGFDGDAGKAIISWT